MCLTLNTKKRYLPNLNSVGGELDDISVVYFSSIGNKLLFSYVNHARIRPWNQPVLSNQSKVSCSRKQRGL